MSIAFFWPRNHYKKNIAQVPFSPIKKKKKINIQSEATKSLLRISIITGYLIKQHLQHVWQCFIVNCNCILFFASFILELPLICYRKVWADFSLANQVYTMFNVTFLLASKNNRIFSNPFLCQNFVFRRVIIWGSITPSSYMRQPFLDKIKQGVLNTCELMLQMFGRLVFHTENIVEGSLLAVFLSSCRPSVYFLSRFSVHSTRSLKIVSKYNFWGFDLRKYFL